MKMKLNLFNDDDILFHYTSNEIALKYILKDKKIRFTPFGQLKDPRESKKWSFDILNARPEDHKKMQEDVNSVFNDFIKTKCKILCLCSNSNEEINIEENAIPHYRIAYYTAGFTKSRMWMQYAANHTGVCLAFSREALNSELKASYGNYKKYSDAVEYQYHLAAFVKAKKIDSRHLVKSCSKDIVKDYIDKYHHEYFFLKLKDFERENEYRFVLVGESDEYIYLRLNT